MYNIFGCMVSFRNSVRKKSLSYGITGKKDFLVLLQDKLPDTMDDKQKLYKVQNLLQSLRKENILVLDSDNFRTANWVLKESN